MPLSSKSQLRFMQCRAHGACKKKDEKSISPSAAKKYIEDSKKSGQDFKKLRERVGKR